MTGFGKADAEFEGKKIHVEVKSLNSKALDLNTRIASCYREREMELRRRVAASVIRGKADLAVWVEKADSEAGATLNPQVVGNYVRQITALSESGIAPAPTDIWNVLCRMPEVYSATAVEEVSEEEWAVVETTLDKALAALEAYRAEEGKALEGKFRHNIDRIEQLSQELVPYEQSRVQKIRQQLEDSLASLKGVDYDRGRLEQELIYYIEKLDINEEKQRLAQHLKYFRETLDGEAGQGKKLGFIAQEMGREINTTGSKSNQAEMQNIVVGMKDELEQIKEQVLNVL